MTRRRFGETWWGRQWVEALEQRASLDPNRLPRGRTYARAGAVGELAVTAGEVTAPVQGSRRTPYQVRVRVRQFSPGEWDVVMDALAAQVGHAAALLEGELQPEVAGDVRGVGLDLLPGAGEVQPRCSCPDWADPCKHAAAVCYLVAGELDRDPFLLFLLRGKGREELLAGVRARRGVLAGGRTGGGGAGGSGSGGGGVGPGGGSGVEFAGGGWPDDAGVEARQVWAAGGRPDPATVALPAPPRHPGRPPLALDPAPPGAGVDTAALVALGADAARRAWALAGGGGPSGPELTFEQDCARWAASMIEGVPAPLGFDELARRAGVGRRELFLRGLAWRAGGPAGLAALVESWDPSPAELAPGRDLLGPGARVSANRVTLGDRQVRLGPDGRWYRYRKSRGTWQPEGGAVSIDSGAVSIDSGAVSIDSGAVSLDGVGASVEDVL